MSPLSNSFVEMTLGRLVVGRCGLNLPCTVSFRRAPPCY